MKTTLLTASVCLLAMSACATTWPPASPSTVRTASAGCVNDTATRLRVPASECAGMGRSYTKQDIERTGQPFTQDALRMLDPSVTVHP